MAISTELKRISKLLEESYDNAFGLIEFMKFVRTEKNDFSGKNNCKLKTISGLFSKSVWSDVSSPGGHITVKHKFTGIVINFSNHKDPVDKGAVVDIAEKIQEHLNILGNEVFMFKSNWKELPNFEKIAKKLLS